MTTESKEFILIVEDDANLADRLAQGLREANYACDIAGSLQDAAAVLQKKTPTLVLLDLGLPDGDGAEFLEKIRSKYADLPVLITTARSSIADRLNGLKSGADDYLIKPYAFEELLARIRIQLRHFERGQLQWIIGDLKIDLPSRTATRAEQLIDLTPREFDLLAYLASLRGEVATRQMIQKKVWNVRSSMASMENVLDVHVSRLRQKLDLPELEPLLHTRRGVGLVLKEQA